MTLYIAKDGHQLGPYSIADVQKMVVAGTLKVNDMAWYEGLTDWIPLKEVPGFFYRAYPVPVRRNLPPLSQMRPTPVWFICVLAFVFTPLELLGKAYGLIYFLTSTDPSALDLQKMHPLFLDASSTSFYQNMVIVYALALVKCLFYLAGAIYLFLLQKRSFACFLVAFIFELINYGYVIFIINLPNVAQKVETEALVGFAIDIVILGYIAGLFKKGILR